MTRSIRIAHITTIDLSLRFLLLGQLRQLREEGFEVTGISAPGPWVSDLEAEGIRHIPWTNATRSWNLGADARAFAELLGILRRERFDLVHTHNPKPGIMGRIAARMAGVPCVVNTIHGLFTTPDDRATKRLPVLALERLAARFSDLELYQSEEDLGWARRISLVSSRKSILLGNGVNLAHFDPSAVHAARLADLRSELGMPDGALVVGTIGRLVAEKGYRELFAAVRTVRASVPDVQLLVLGDTDPEKADTLSREEVEKARDHVIFAGWRPDVRDLLALMDVFVLASRREGLPRSAVEAAAMARPLVLTDIRGCREVARTDDEGILVPPRNPERLAEAILRLLRDPELRTRFGTAARARALQRFDERRVADTVAATYKQLLARKAVMAAPDGPVQLRRARLADVSTLARIHREIPDAFLSSLGDRFLKRLYRALVSDREALVVVAENGRGIVGFATGVPSVPGFYRRFYRQHGAGAALAAAPKLLRPATIRRAMETARYPQDMGPFPEAELLSIAVAPGARARGVGRMLAEGIRRGLAERGVSEFKVVVDVPNEPSNRLFSRLGFECRAQITLHDGVPSNVWVKQTQPVEVG